MSKSTISFYFSHDASVAISPYDGVYRVYEMERLTGKRYYSLTADPLMDEILKNLKNIILKDYPKIKFKDARIVKSSPWGHLVERNSISRIFGVKETSIYEVGHHLAHAAGAVHCSPFKESLIISYDGGGFDEDNTCSTFNIFHYKSEGNEYKRILSKPIDLGNAYACIATSIKEIKKGNYLSYSGKLMGLCAYGKVVPNWVPHFIKYYNDMFFQDELLPKLLQNLGDNIGVEDLHKPDSIHGNTSYDIAATSQHAFEEIVMSIVLPYIKSYDLPVCITGGCALNVLFNESLRKTIKQEVFVPPNPSDCGLSFGGLVYECPPKERINITYSGFNILDLDILPHYVNKYGASKIGTKGIAKLVSSGKIIGIARGLSECGPRALGNRSIICDPSIADMKDTLNRRVKFREWFRPFAPIVRESDVNQYFETEKSSEFMSFAPQVRKDWALKVPSVTHEDGTSRVQTVSREQNSYIYDILDELEKLYKIPMILNTSFNILGKPILTTVKESIEILETTEIDFIIIEDYLFNKIKH